MGGKSMLDLSWTALLASGWCATGLGGAQLRPVQKRGRYTRPPVKPPSPVMPGLQARLHPELDHVLLLE